MKKFNNVMMMVAFIAICFACRLNVLAAANWTLEPSGWKYQQEDGSFATGRITIDGVEYLFNEFGDLVSETTGWSNEEEAINIGKEIQNSNGLSQNPIRILDNSASFGDSTPVITISKNGNGYDLTIKTRIQANSTSQGLKAICMLTGISGLYDTIYDAYEGSNSNGINYDTPVTIGGHSYIATNNGSNMVFHIQ